MRKGGKCKAEERGNLWQIKGKTAEQGRIKAECRIKGTAEQLKEKELQGSELSELQSRGEERARCKAED